MTMPKFLTDAPRYMFFTGKGGVGKTSIACASALILARTGKSVLLVATDPASNLGQVFGIQIGNRITAIESVRGLSALEIDPEQAANAYRERIIGPMRALLSEAEIASMTEQLSGSCTTEIAAFDEFTALLTGTTARLPHSTTCCSIPRRPGTPSVCCNCREAGPPSWKPVRAMRRGLGPLAGLEKQKAMYAAKAA